MNAIKLRTYQADLTDAIRDAYRGKKRAPLVVLSTGGGKTTIFAYVTAGAAAKGKTVWLLCHRSELVEQIAMTLAKFGCAHRVIAPEAIVRQVKIAEFKEFGSSFVDHTSRVLVASVQTIVRRMESGLLPPPNIIVVDEAHHLTLDSQWGQVVAAYPAALVLPVTATPCRLDGKGLGVESGGFADDIIIGPSMRWLIEQGYLSPYRIFAPPTALDLSHIKTRMGDFAKEALAGAMDKPIITGSAVEHYRKLARGKRAVTFCVSVAHAEHVAAEFAAAGVPAEFLDGSLDPIERKARIKRFESGETLVLTSCDVVSEGFDLPAIEVAILLRPTKSLSLYLQQVGRALRVFPGKTEAIILDHVGAVARHGLPDEEREWTLDGVTKKKRAANDNDEAPLTIRTCPTCYTIHEPAPTCPNCGYVYPDKGRKPEVADGELVELSASAKEEMRKAAEEAKRQAQLARKREDAKANTFESLVELGRQRGYAFPEAWAKNKLKGREQSKRRIFA